MNRYMNKAAAVLAILAVSLCAGCNGNAAQTTTTAALSLIADDDTSEDEILLDDSEEFDVEYGDWDVEEFGEVIEDVSGIDVESGETETDEDEQRTDKSAELIAKLQTNGQVIYSDEFCQIRYFGETKDDDGNLTFVLGYSKFHGALVRINKASFVWGSAVDGSLLWFSPMNSFDDGYWYHSGAHGSEFYDDPAKAWWKDNEYIYLRSPSNDLIFEKTGNGYDYAKYAELSEAAGEYTKYDDSVYDSVSTAGLHIGELVIQESIHMTGSETEPPYFEEPTEENTHKCSTMPSSTVIRVRFDPEKAELWAHT